MIEIFKTNVQDGKQSALLVRKLSRSLPGSSVSFDLEDCDKILRIEGDDFSPETVIELLNNNGRHCEILY
ncbi:MAG: hypothetical protein V4577_16780 [Bacteroidota bacterium]